MLTSTPEASRFTDALRKVLSVSHVKMRELIEAEKRQKKPSASRKKEQ